MAKVKTQKIIAELPANASRLNKVLFRIAKKITDRLGFYIIGVEEKS